MAIAGRCAPTVTAGMDAPRGAADATPPRSPRLRVKPLAFGSFASVPLERHQSIDVQALRPQRIGAAEIGQVDDELRLIDHRAGLA